MTALPHVEVTFNYTPDVRLHVAIVNAPALDALLPFLLHSMNERFSGVQMRPSTADVARHHLLALLSSLVDAGVIECHPWLGWRILPDIESELRLGALDLNALPIRGGYVP